MRILLVSLILSLNSAFAAAAVPALLEEALQKLQADENHWAYTQTTQVYDRKGEVDGGVTVERFDPSLPYDQQWTLLQQDGREPTAREERSWRKRKDREMKRREEKSLGEIMDLERAREVERYAGQVVFEVPLQPGASRRLPAEKFAVLMAVDEASATLSEFMLKTTDSFRALGVAKVDRIEIKADFATVDPQYVPQPRRIFASGAGRLLFFRVGGSAEITWTDFKRVKPYEDRFEVQIGELKVFGF
ncbi:MAG: hypothetical protein H7A44_00810 [Opitutaceae bacterium]|nr:hypothetical protein [Cephaloticoccus sp.]MCP5528951.1 hypothetical protein [Opitutaceae bacterium]